MERTSKVIFYPNKFELIGFAGKHMSTSSLSSLGELKLQDDILTLTTESSPSSVMVTNEIDKVLFQKQIRELDGYSHNRGSSFLTLYLNKKTILLDFDCNVSLSRSIWNTYKGNKGDKTGVYDWVDLLDEYGVKKRINYKSLLTGAIAVFIIGVTLLIKTLTQG